MERKANHLVSEGMSLHEAGIHGPREVMETVLGRMLETRPRLEVSLKPYMELPFFHQEPLSGPACLDFEAAYPGQEPGAVAFGAAWLVASQQEEATFSLQGEARVWLNGKTIYGQGAEEGGAAVRREGGTAAQRREGGWTIIPVLLSAGKNELLVRCEKGEGGWGIRYLVSHPRYWMMWARDYLLNVRVTLPFARMEGMEGMACIGPFPGEAAPDGLIPVLYGADWEHLGRKYCWIPQWEAGREQDRVDFEAWYGTREGAAYGLTYCHMEEGESCLVEVQGAGRFTLWVDGVQEACGSRICSPVNGNGRDREILIKCIGEGQGFSMEAQIRGRNLRQAEAEKHGGNAGAGCDAPDADSGKTVPYGVPFVKTGRNTCARWLYLGPFAAGMLSGAPEEEIQFRRPYPLGDYRHGFWTLGAVATGTVSVRPYMDGIFFGQWFYAVQVGMMGVLTAAKALERPDLLRYFLDSVQVMADYFDYSQWEYRRGLNPTMIPRSCELRELDPCGTIGVSMTEAYLVSGNERLLAMARHIADRVMEHVLRFSDDTYYRGETMWADDFYMSCPFLARMARLTGEARYRQRVYAQVEGFTKRLWMEERRLFSHIFFPDKGKRDMEEGGRGEHADGGIIGGGRRAGDAEEGSALAGHINRVPWGRGNGWIALALTEILELLEGWQESGPFASGPWGREMHSGKGRESREWENEQEPRDSDWERTLALYREFAAGIAAVQDSCGMWHQVLDRPDTYLETSCTAMFVLSLKRGLNRGWLDESLAAVAERGWNAMLKYALDKDGNVYGVCLGSGCSMEASYYDSIPTHKNDDHGTGIILMAAAEMMENGNKR